MNHPRTLYSYIGIDSHKDSHCAVILNCFFEKLGEVTFPNTPATFEDSFAKISKLKMEGTSLAFGMEDTSVYGRHFTVFLQKKNILVKHVNASLVASERKSLNVVEKTDSIDAECAARVLLNRFKTLPEANIQDKYWIMQALVVRRRNAIKMNISLKNHLHAFLTGHYPSYTSFFCTVDAKSALAFFDKYPSPSLLKGVTAEELKEFLSDFFNSPDATQKAELILSLVESDGETETEYQESRNLVIKSTLSQLKSNMREIDSIEQIIESFMKNFDYQLETMTGVETTTAAELISEIGDIKLFSTPAKLARYSGIAPVTYASGKKDFKYSNQRGNRILNSIFYRIALWMIKCSGTKNKKILNPFFYHYYNKKIKEGKTKRQALKCVQRRLVTIVWGMMTHKTPYVAPPMEDYKEEPPTDQASTKPNNKSQKSKSNNKNNSTKTK